MNSQRTLWLVITDFNVVAEQLCFALGLCASTMSVWQRTRDGESRVLRECVDGWLSFSVCFACRVSSVLVQGNRVRACVCVGPKTILSQPSGGYMVEATDGVQNWNARSCLVASVVSKWSL